MKYSDMQRELAKSNHERVAGDADSAPITQEHVKHAHAKRDTGARKQSDSPVDARLYRLTSPVRGHEYCLQVTVNSVAYDALMDVVVDARGNRSFELGAGEKLERVSAYRMLRSATVTGEKSALPKDVRDLIEQAQSPDPDDSDQIAAIGT